MAEAADESDASAANANLRDYNAVFEHYVHQDGKNVDLVGMLAYALYKKQKREWIIDYREARDGAKPSEEALGAVTSSYLTQDMQDTLRERASEILTSYAETYVEAVEPDIRLNAVRDEAIRQAQGIADTIKSQNGLWQQIKAGLITSGIWTAVVTVLALAVTLFGSDITDAFNALRAIFSQ